MAALGRIEICALASPSASGSQKNPRLKGAGHRGPTRGCAVRGRLPLPWAVPEGVAAIPWAPPEGPVASVLLLGSCGWEEGITTERARKWQAPRGGSTMCAKNCRRSAICEHERSAAVAGNGKRAFVRAGGLSFAKWA